MIFFVENLTQTGQQALRKWPTAVVRAASVTDCGTIKVVDNVGDNW